MGEDYTKGPRYERLERLRKLSPEAPQDEQANTGVYARRCGYCGRQVVVAGVWIDGEPYHDACAESAKKIRAEAPQGEVSLAELLAREVDEALDRGEFVRLHFTLARSILRALSQQPAPSEPAADDTAVRPVSEPPNTIRVSPDAGVGSGGLPAADTMTFRVVRKERDPLIFPDDDEPAADADSAEWHGKTTDPSSRVHTTPGRPGLIPGSAGAAADARADYEPLTNVARDELTHTLLAMGYRREFIDRLLDAGQRCAGLEAALGATVAAIRYAEKHYLPSVSAAAEVWSFCNGYDGSPNVLRLLAPDAAAQEPDPLATAQRFGE